MATFVTDRKLGGVESITVTPFDASGKALSANSYVLDDIVENTLSIAQDDPTENPINGETKDEPIFENTTLGSYKVSFSSGNIPDELLTNLMGFTLKGSMLAAPKTYKSIYAKLEVALSSSKDIMVCPKFKVNGKIEATSLKTGMVQGTITGTCYSEKVGSSPNEIETPFYIQKNV